jgi:hypothetical protein
VPRFGDGDDSGGSQRSDGVPSPHHGGATTQPMSEPPPPGDTEGSHWYETATMELQRTLARLNAKVATDPEGISSADLETLQR